MAYMMSRFPKITETFVLYEMKAVEACGIRVEVFPLLREREANRHPEAEAYVRRAHYAPFMSWEILCANWRMLRRDPERYLRTWWRCVSGTRGYLNFFVGALVYFPKSVLFAERMSTLGVDHIHAHFANHPALAALVVHGLTGIPFSFTAHGSDLHVNRTMLPQKVSDAAFVVTVSSYNRDLILEECGESAADKVVVIHCGADPKVFAAGAQPGRNGCRPDGSKAIRVACVASLQEVKGHRFLIEACALLAREGVDVRCELAGDGPLRRDLERLATELGIATRVRFRGAVPREEVRRILTEVDVAVLASYPTRSGKREGIPVALMESMMSGLPVVASALSGIPELVDDGRTGYLVAPGDPWALADRLRLLAESPSLRQEMGSAARRKVAREFDLEEGARRLVTEIDRRLAG